MIIYKPAHGYGINWLLQLLKRNDPCPCNSGKKFKKCCSKGMPKYIPKAYSERMEKTNNKEERISIFNSYLRSLEDKKDDKKMH